jgi:hypothetical protein
METTIQVETSVQVETPFDHDAWCKEGEELGRLSRYADFKLNWDIGDWVLRAEKHFRTAQYNEAEKITGLARGTLQNIVSVARAFPASRRREALSFSHHQLVRKLPVETQDYLLDECVFNNRSVDDLREYVEREDNAGVPKDPKSPGRNIGLSFSVGDFKYIKSLAKARKIRPADVLIEIIGQYVRSNKKALDAELEKAKVEKKKARTVAHQ